MELHLVEQTGTEISVTCDGQPSHTFDLQTLVPNKEKALPQLLDDPITYGKAIYQALFPPTTPAARTLNQELQKIPARILLVSTSDDLDTIPWEYAYGPDGFLILESHFLRGLPIEQRIPPPTLDSGLHIVAIPSNPLDKNTQALNIDGEWIRLKEIVENVPYAITLDRTRPPTIEQTRTLLANQRQRIVHFMGHGGQHKNIGAFLCFEKDNGELDLVTARQFVLRIRGTVFLVTLNACISATPGPTLFSNLAAALVRQQIPYALGMRFSILDEDARAFSRTFYNDLARGSSVEEALLQARLTLANSPRPWAIGVPVLYTSLAQPPAAFTCTPGTPTINEHQSKIEAGVLPRAEGAFQGRIDELKALGSHLTGDNRPRIITIHGGGGQGKTTLAREAIERFAHAWPGGVWATSLENLPDRATFVVDLARYLGIPTQEIADPAEVERRVLTLLIQRRVLLILDNAETLIDAVERNDASALHLVEFIKQLPSTSVSLLVTSRVQLAWSGEVSYELGGLSPQEGADLFRQSAPQRREEISPTLAEELSHKLEGHPLGLLLLGKAFNASAISLPTFLQECDTYLAQAENKYLGPEHRHRTLNACIEVSVHYLNADLRTLLSGLWIFRDPFLAETAVAIFDPEHEDSEEHPSHIQDCLHTLWQRGLLARETITVRDGTIQLYHLLPTTRPYVEHHLEQAFGREKLLTLFGAAYSRLIEKLHRELDRSAVSVVIAQKTREDLQQGIENVTGVVQGFYLRHCGWILHRLGNPRSGLALLERSLEIAQDQDRNLELMSLSDLASIYQATSQPQKALALYEKALSIARKEGRRVEEVVLFNNMGVVYQAIGKLQEALAFYERALPILRGVGDWAGETTTLTNIAAVYQATGKPQEALALYEQALPISRRAGHRVGEGNVLNNIGEVYEATGKPQEALSFYEQALPIMHEIGNRAGEATTFNNMANVYQATGHPQEALSLYEQALLIRQEVGNRAGEAATLTDMALMYQATGKPNKALALYKQALPIMQEVNNRAGEAATLNNVGLVYQATGRPEEALKLYEQALPIMREVGNRAGEAATLNNIAGVYQATGRVQEALALYEQALPIRREVGNRRGEAMTLNNIAALLQATGRPEEALKLYEQALPIMREVGNRAGEAATLDNIAGVYQATGRVQEALVLYEQALPIRGEVGDRGGKATTLNNMAGVYETMGKPEEALALYKKALPIIREVGDRDGEATTLNNIGLVYQIMGKLQEALELYEQVLLIRREVGDREGEATTLNNIAGVYKTMSKKNEALALYEKVLLVMQEVGNRAKEAAILTNIANLLQDMHRIAEAQTSFELSISLSQQVIYPAVEVVGLVGLALLFYQHLNRPQDAIERVEQAIAILNRMGLPQDAAGHKIEDLQHTLQVMQKGEPLT